jgi:uncharacterized membrane protein YkvI
MKKLMFLVLSVLMLGTITTTLDTKVATLEIFPVAYAQEADAPAEPSEPAKPAVEVEDRDISIGTASDLEDSRLEIPVWVGSVVMFLESIPTVGPFITKALGFMGLAAAILTFLASLLMGVSGILVMLGANKDGSPKWLKDAKKYVDWAVDITKYLSMFNKQKK